MVIIVLASCYERQDGCLDSYASNYDIDGDDQCDNCCQYPNLNFAIGHYNGQKSFSTGDTITTASEPLVLLDFVYTISKTSLNNTIDTIQVLDTVKLSNNTIIPDDLTKIKPTTYTNKIGTFKYEGTLKNVRFQLGLPDDLDSHYITNDSHALNNSNDSLRQNNVYYQQRIKYAKGTNFKDTVQVDLLSTSGNIDYIFNKDITTIRGTSLTIKFKADYSKWFDNIDLNQSVENISKDIFQNQSDFITIE